MALQNYGVLKARPINKKIGLGNSPHYQIHMIDDTTDYRIAVNVKSKLSPSELLYVVDENFTHPLIEDLKDFKSGFTPVASKPEGIALDYIRSNLFDPRDMVPLAHNIPGPDNDLNEKIDHFVQIAINDISSSIFAFGERWGPEPHKKDDHFGYRPGNGIHDIHMNQGNVGDFIKDDGVWQDGGLLFHFPGQDRWVGIFLAFQSQAWHTDDKTGHTITHLPISDGIIRIIAAKINPEGNDTGKETVTLINTSPDSIDLNGWSIVDKNKKREILSGLELRGCETVSIKLSGSGAQLSNKGGIITLLDNNGIKIDGISYNGGDVKKQGWSVVF